MPTRGLQYFESRVGRRVLSLFVLGAVLPVLLMGAAAYNAMGTQLRRQSTDRVRATSRNARQAVMQQLTLTESGVRLAAEALQQGETPAREAIPRAIGGIAVTVGTGRPETILGTPFATPLLLESEWDHLARGDMVLKIRPGAPEPIMAAVALRPGVTEAGSQSLDPVAPVLDREESAVVWAVLEGDSIWGSAERFATGGATRDFCVVVARDALYCSDPGAATVPAFLSAVGGDTGSSGVVTALSEQERLLIGHSELFLEAAFAAPPVRVLVSEALSDLYGGDAALFRYSFGGALLLGLLVMALLAGVQIRRTMTPLEALTAATRQLAEGDLSARVPVTSQDEFGLLAQSFNTMAQRLDVQFQALAAGRAIDRAVLTAPDADGVVDGLLHGFDALVSCRSVAVLLLRRSSQYRGVLHWGEGDDRDGVTVNLSPYDREWLTEAPDGRVAAHVSERPPFLMQAVEALGPSPLTVLPLISQGELLGAVLFEAADDQVPDPELVARGRQVADQAAVALDAVRLVGELEETNLGTLRALARAIDAKSRWTAGHSERVTELAVELGRALGLGEGDLDILQRGGLLHDVGKIGVPAEILDSREEPTPQQWALIREHPVIGARILEPIRALDSIMPLVLQHHERWDGKGYPSGLEGEQIHPLARILALADSFDAMASPRPYREPLATSAVLAEIAEGAGTQFDPSLVPDFLAVMAARGVRPTPHPGRTRG